MCHHQLKSLIDASKSSFAASYDPRDSQSLSFGLGVWLIWCQIWYLHHRRLWGNAGRGLFWQIRALTWLFLYLRFPPLSSHVRSLHSSIPAWTLRHPKSSSRHSSWPSSHGSPSTFPSPSRLSCTFWPYSDDPANLQASAFTLLPPGNPCWPSAGRLNYQKVNVS